MSSAELVAGEATTSIGTANCAPPACTSSAAAVARPQTTITPPATLIG